MKQFLLNTWRQAATLFLFVSVCATGANATTYTETTVWEGSEQISWNTEVAPGTQFETPEGTFSDLEAGNIIRVYTTTEYEEPQYVVTYKKGDSWDWTDLDITVADDGVISIPVSDETTATEIAQRGLILRGQAWTATKIVIAVAGEEEETIEEAEKVKWTGSEQVSWNESVPGKQYETPSGTFTGLKVGDIVRIYSTPTEGEYGDPQYTITYKAGDSWTWTDLTTTVANGVVKFIVTDDTQASEIAERGLVLRGQAWTATKITVNDFTSIVLKDTEIPVVDAGTYAAVKVNRTLLAGFNTIIVPFATTAAELAGGSEAYAAVMKSVSEAGDELTFVKVDEMEANKPYLIYVTADTEIPVLSNKTLVAIPADYWEWQNWDYNGKWHMQGVYEPQPVEGKYVVSGANTIAKGSSSATLKGLRAYIEAPAETPESSVKGALTIAVEDSETGITTVLTPAQVSGLMFNLAGQRLSQPARGINIIGGRKVMVK